METFKNLRPSEAIEIQKKLQTRIRLTPLSSPIRFLAGCDVSFNKFSEDIYATILVFEYPSLHVVEVSSIKSKSTFPYIPGLLSFRESPALLEAYEKLTIQPDLLVLDGQGIAHPRRLGIASHFGILIDKPTIGSAKSILYGVHEPVGLQAGDMSVLVDPKLKRDDPKAQLGMVIRSKNRSKPIIVSPGHLISIKESTHIIQSCLRGYRIPEPTRQAHNYVNEFRKSFSDSRLAAP